MTKVVFLIMGLTCTLAMAQQQSANQGGQQVQVASGANVNICQPKIEIKSCGACCNKPKVVIKTVEKIVEKPVIVVKEVEKKVEVTKFRKIRTNIGLLVGIGPKGNLRETQEPGYVQYSTDNGPVAALQISHDISKDSSRIAIPLYLQLQTNRTALIGIGVGF